MKWKVKSEKWKEAKQYFTFIFLYLKDGTKLFDQINFRFLQHLPPFHSQRRSSVGRSLHRRKGISVNKIGCEPANFAQALFLKHLTLLTFNFQLSTSSFGASHD